jgi:hypothetical protein
MNWFRSSARAIAATLLTSLATLAISFVRPHPVDCHDAGCAAAAVVHDASAHRVRGDTSGVDSHPLHCSLCHWARSFRPHIETKFVPAPATAAGAHIHLAFLTPAHRAPLAQPPLRSPPASSAA